MAKVRSIHTRDIAAPAPLVGAILDTLGSEKDRLWARDIWVAEPVMFDRPLGVGAQGGHGSIRYAVQEYEPGRRIMFRFTPGSGLSGTHGFEIQALDADRSRLAHVLDADLSRWLRPLRAVLIGWHDAMIETAFDRAELEAVGSLARRTRIPPWLRVINGVEVAVGRLLGTLPPAEAHTRASMRLGYRLFRPCAVFVPVTLATIAATHAAWALGWRWPGGTDQALADRVVGTGAELPPAPLTWAVAVALTGAAAIAAAVGAGRRERILRLATWSLAGILIARGTLFIPIDVVGGLDNHFARLDLAIYSPLSLALGIGAAIVARGPRPLHAAPRIEHATMPAQQTV